MTDLAIQVQAVGKRYRLGGGQQAYGTLRDALASAAQASLRAVRARQISADAQDLWALRDVSFEVRQGDVVGIVGRNGAGKSTLLKLLSRVTRPTTGRAVIYGRVGSLLEVGTGFHPELSGRENIYFNGAVLGMTKADIRRNFEAIVEFAEIDRFLDTPVKRYSSGMYMRLAFSIAAHLEPDILIVDEVLAVGDATFQKKCLGKMGHVAQEGRTVLFVSHSMPAVLSLCSRAVLLQAGHLVDQGSPSHIVQRYLASQVTNGAISLTDRDDRSGDGSARLVSLRVESTDPDRIIRSRSRLRLTLGYRSAAPVRRAQFLITIADQMDIGLFVLDNDIGGGLPTLLPPEGTVTCVTDPINLAPGRCFVTLELLKGNVCADLVKYAATFDVVPDDTAGAGTLRPRNWALCLLPHAWSMEAC
jgi:lipopolysaccharide transport system ATP-binding protein